MVQESEGSRQTFIVAWGTSVLNTLKRTGGTKALSCNEPLQLGCFVSQDYHSSAAGGAEGANSGGHGTHSIASKHQCVCEMRVAKKEVRVSDEDLGEFPGHSWRGIIICGPKPVTSSMPYFATPHPSPKRLPLLGSLSSEVKIRPSSKGGNVMSRQEPHLLLEPHTALDASGSTALPGTSIPICCLQQPSPAASSVACPLPPRMRSLLPHCP